MKALTTLTAAFGLIATLSLAGEASAAQTNVAVAANFTDPAKEIAAAFKAKTGHEAVLSFGSSGQFYTQIKQHAPFQIFLGAAVVYFCICYTLALYGRHLERRVLQGH